MSSRYEQLHDFISKKMRMAHIYQPVMLLELLRQRGAVSKTKIAQALLARDVAQVEYYEEITRNMVGRVLTKNHEIADRDGDTYRLLGFSDLSVAEIANLEALCINKIEEYVARRGDRIWEHRRKPSDYVPGTLRYEVLKRARFRCELCGISADRWISRSCGAGASGRRRGHQRGVISPCNYIHYFFCNLAAVESVRNRRDMTRDLNMQATERCYFIAGVRHSLADPPPMASAACGSVFAIIKSRLASSAPALAAMRARVSEVHRRKTLSI